MWFNDYMKKDRYVSFHDAVEENAIKLEDYHFVRLTRTELKKTAKEQRETDAESYIAKWENHVGELVFRYNAETGVGALLDSRIIDKDSLTHYAARKLVKCLHDGNGKIEEFCIEGSVALMLFVRSGLKKRDFARAFHKEIVAALEEVIGGQESVEVEEVLLASPYRTSRVVTKSLEIFEEVYERDISYDKALILVDSEIEPIIRGVNRKSYREETIEAAIGQYVIFDDWLGLPELRREDLLKCNPKNLYFYSVGNCTYSAASALEQFFFFDDCQLDRVIRSFRRGLAIYRKNGFTDADYWRNVCKELHKYMTSDHFYLNWQKKLMPGY